MNKKAGAGIFFFWMSMIICTLITGFIWLAGSVIISNPWNWAPIILRIIAVTITTISLIIGTLMHFIEER
jgi:hypothetical protein